MTDTLRERVARAIWDSAHEYGWDSGAGPSAIERERALKAADAAIEACGRPADERDDTAIADAADEATHDAAAFDEPDALGRCLRGSLADRGLMIVTTRPAKPDGAPRFVRTRIVGVTPVGEGSHDGEAWFPVPIDAKMPPGQ